MGEFYHCGAISEVANDSDLKTAPFRVQESMNGSKMTTAREWFDPDVLGDQALGAATK